MPRDTRSWKMLVAASALSTGALVLGAPPATALPASAGLVSLAFPAGEDRGVSAPHPERAAERAAARAVTLEPASGGADRVPARFTDRDRQPAREDSRSSTTARDPQAARAARRAERFAASDAALAAAAAQAAEVVADAAAAPPAASAARTTPDRARDRDRAPAATGTASASEASFGFTMSVFNILGSNHTAPGHDADHFAPGRIRTEWAVNLLRQHDTSIVGWSEIQADQLAGVMRATNNEYGVWPGAALQAKGIPASLMWRTSDWQVVSRHTVDIPFIGQVRPMPYVQLRHIATGRTIWVMNVHNAPNDRSAERNVAEARELEIIRDLVKTGDPVFFIGDMNEKAEIFCEVTGTTSLVSASGGSNDSSCRPPVGRLRVDWIFGTRNAEFSNYRADRGPMVARVTDHAVIVSRVTIP